MAKARFLGGPRPHHGHNHLILPSRLLAAAQRRRRKPKGDLQEKNRYNKMKKLSLVKGMKDDRPGKRYSGDLSLRAICLAPLTVRSALSFFVLSSTIITPTPTTMT